MRPEVGLLALALLAAWLGFADAKPAARVGPGYRWFCTGSRADVQPRPTPGLLLAGGGTDVDAAFVWLVRHAAGGDVVILRASGTDAYDPYIFGLSRTDSVETIIVTDARGARDPFVVDRVRKAEALFFAGGNQWDYVRLWKGTPLGAAIQKLADRGVPMGGTSAGLAILGEHVFSAAHDTITSAQALANPYDWRLTMEHHFLKVPHLGEVVTDTHFVKRDRMGRLLVFMARTLEDGFSPVRAIAVDEATAVLVEADGHARVSGRGTAYFLQVSGSRQRTPGPLDLADVRVWRVGPGGRFDLAHWMADGGAPYRLDVEHGVVRSSRGAIY